MVVVLLVFDYFGDCGVTDEHAIDSFQGSCPLSWRWTSLVGLGVFCGMGGDLCSLG